MSSDSFFIPLHLEDIELEKENRFYVKGIHEFEFQNKNAMHEVLETLSMQLLDDPTCLYTNEVFDQLYSIVKNFSSLKDTSTKQTLLEVLCSTMTEITQQCNNKSDSISNRHMRNLIKMNAFLLSYTIIAANKTLVKKTNDVVEKKLQKERKTVTDTSALDFTRYCEAGLCSLVQSLSDEYLNIWEMRVPEEELANMYCKVAFELLENPVLMRSKTLKPVLYQLVGNLLVKVTSLTITITTSLMQLVFAHEHAGSPIAELLYQTQKTFNESRASEDMLREIGKVRDVSTSRDTSAAKNVSAFLVHFSGYMPALLLSNISLLLPLLDAESYYLRNGIVVSIANVLQHEFKRPDTEEENNTSDVIGSSGGTNKTRDTLLNVLHERAHDVNSFSRSTVLKVWMELIRAGVVPLSHFARVTNCALDRLFDRSVNVRKNAINLLATLLECNPFMGNLSREIYVTKIQEVEASMVKEEDEEEEEGEEAKMQRYVLNFYKSAVEFIDQVENATSTLCKLLQSKCSGDVLEAVNYLSLAFKFNIAGSRDGIRQMLILVWRTDVESIKKLLLETFSQLFFLQPESKTKFQSSSQVAINLLELVQDMNLAEEASLEELMKLLLQQDLVPNGVERCLWEIFAELESNSISRRNSLRILSMISAAKPSCVQQPDRLSLLLKFGVGEAVLSEKDWITFKISCVLLQHAASTTDKSDEISRLLRKAVFRIKKFLVTIADEDSVVDNLWFAAAEQGINTIFKLCDRPEEECSEVVKDGSNHVFSNEASPNQLAKFLFTTGHIGLKVLLYVESLAATAKKLRHNNTAKTPTDNDNASMEDELGMSAEVDAEEDAFLQNLIQTEIVEKNLLGLYGPLISRVVENANNSFGSTAVVAEASTLALCKFMCISSDYCERNLRLLFTKLRDSKIPSVRANIMIALGDLSFRFPNLIEPWTSHLYARLRDDDVSVRKNALMVLTHLILNDMVKVKGQITEIVMSIKDPDTRIQSAAKLFFHELSKRGNNPIYNLLPDTMSQLSQRNLSKEEFQDLTKFLLGFISKDRQVESLVEKLCNRFTKTDDVKQWRDISYCLSSLPFNGESSLKRLADSSKSYKNIMHDDEVYENFSQIIAKARKSKSKSTMQTSVDELESELKLLHSGSDASVHCENTVPSNVI